MSDEGLWEGEGPVARALLAYVRKTPKHPSKVRIFRALAHALSPKGLAIRNEFGVRLLLDPLDYIGHAICVTGSFEPLSLRLARRLMKEGGTFLDVGSNTGLFTCSLALIPGVQCIAVDAAAPAFARLQENLLRNPDVRVSAVNVALGAKRSLVQLEKPGIGNSGTTRVAGELSTLETGSHVVAAIPLDELLTRAKADSIRLMKIDVEGYELEVFQGMNATANYWPQNIIMEWVPDFGLRRGNLELCFKILSDHGYEPLTVAGARFSAGQPLPEENVWWRRC